MCSSDLDRVREAVKKGAGCRLALPLNHAALPRNAAQLKELGAGYSNCAPTPEARLLRSMSEQAAAQRKIIKMRLEADPRGCAPRTPACRTIGPMQRTRTPR